MGYKGVREGREMGVGLPRELEVGRTGKGPARVPSSMLKALGVGKEDEEEVKARRMETLRRRFSDAKNKVIKLENECELTWRSLAGQTLMANIRANLDACEIRLSQDAEGEFTMSIHRH